MKIEVFIDEQTSVYATVEPPNTFKIDTTKLNDGHHTIRFKAISDDGSISTRETQFSVRNGPGIAVHGIRDGDIVSGEVAVLANAYSSRVGDVFEPMRIETPAPIPTWAWLVLLVVFAWGMWYLGSENKSQRSLLDAMIGGSADLPGETEKFANSTATVVPTERWSALGKQVYQNKCASCHQASGEGLPGLFPPLKGNPVVTATDWTEHVQIVLDGLRGKVIDGTAYASPMPPFGATLSDEEVAAVVNHERKQWGNSSPTVTPAQVAAIRE